MTSLHDSLMGSHGSAVLLDVQGNSITRYPKGDLGSPDDDVNAIFTPETATRDRRRGDATVRPAMLLVDADQETDAADLWDIDEDRYATVAVGHADGGMVPIEIKRTEKRHTTPGNTEVS